MCSTSLSEPAKWHACQESSHRYSKGTHEGSLRLRTFDLVVVDWEQNDVDCLVSIEGDVRGGRLSTVF